MTLPANTYFNLCCATQKPSRYFEKWTDLGVEAHTNFSNLNPKVNLISQRNMYLHQLKSGIHHMRDFHASFNSDEYPVDWSCFNFI